LDRVICPQSGERLSPDSVWDTKTPSGKPQRLGVLPKHHHGASWHNSKDGKPCDWNGLPVPVERESVKD